MCQQASSTRRRRPCVDLALVGERSRDRQAHRLVQTEHTLACPAQPSGDGFRPDGISQPIGVGTPGKAATDFDGVAAPTGSDSKGTARFELVDKILQQIAILFQARPGQLRPRRPRQYGHCDARPGKCSNSFSAWPPNGLIRQSFPDRQTAIGHCNPDRRESYGRTPTRHTMSLTPGSTVSSSDHKLQRCSSDGAVPSTPKQVPSGSMRNGPPTRENAGRPVKMRCIDRFRRNGDFCGTLGRPCPRTHHQRRRTSSVVVATICWLKRSRYSFSRASCVVSLALHSASVGSTTRKP